MNARVQLITVLMAALFLVPLSGLAQTLDFDVLIDSDRSVVTGCSVTPTGGSPLDGIDTRLRAIVDTGTLEITALETAQCTGGTFSAPVPVAGVSLPYPVATNLGVGGADAIELEAPRSALGADGSALIELVFAADNGTGSDLLATIDGSPDGGPILFGLPFQIPALSMLGLGLLIAGLLILAALAHRRMGRTGIVLAVMLVATAAWAMHFAADGDLSDWTGAAPKATDQAGDATDGSAAVDLVAAFIALENDRLFFRLDVVDLENQIPVAVDDAFATDEDTPLNVAAPGVLGNDSDGNNDPLTAVLDSGPANAQTFTFNADGSFAYTPATDFNGSDGFTYFANDGQSNSDPATVTITINPVNDPPLAAADSATTNEDAPVDIDVLANDSDVDVDGNLDPATVSVISGPANGTTSVDPSTGVITYTKAADFNGSDNFDYEVCDDGTPLPAACATATVTITVDPVNDAPSFTAGADVAVNEDAGPQSIAGWATGISAGPPDEAGQVLTFNITGNTNPGLFSAGPAVNAAGDLSFTPAADANGNATITLNLSDDGGTANGGVDTSPPQSFTITVDPVNDAPSFTAGSDQTVLEDAGPQTAAGWATGISAGPADESGQALTFNVTGNNNPGLFAAGPMVNAAGDLSYTPAADANGSATITLTLSDDGGTANGGVDTSPPQNFTINVDPVNDAPSFTAGADVTVDEDSGPQTVAAWATGISAGPPDESGQALTFNITGNTNPGLFSAGPAVNSAGDLSFTSAPDAFGNATITLTLSDDGGTANGGVDTAPAQSFTITVNPVNDPPMLINHTLTTHSAIRITLGAGDSEKLKDGATDVDDPFAALSVSPLAATSTNGAMLTLVDSDTGTYQYDPPGGFTGSDSFMYEVCDSATTAPPVQCTTASVNVTVTSPALWVVDPAAAAGGDGSLNRPFQALSNLPGGRAAGGRVFLATGTNAGGHSYVANERLIGQGATGNTFDGFFGVLVPANGTLDTRPAMGGARPTVQGQVTLASGVLALGFDIAPASGTQGLVGSGALSGIEVDQMAITTANAAAVNLNGPTGTFTLDRVDANGGPNGIALVNTNSAAGSFTVTGTGGACTAATPTCSGGRIQATTGANGAVAGNGIYLENTRSVSLTRMRVGGHQNHAIFGDTVTGFTLTDSLVDGANGNDAGADEGSIRFVNLLGSGAITRADISGGLEDNLRLVNSTGTLDRLVITDTIFRDNSAALGNDGILIEANGTAVVNVTVDNSDFSAHRGDHFDAAATDDASLDLVFTNNGMSGGHSSPLGQSFILSNAQSSDVTFDVSDNSINGSIVTAFLFFQSASSTAASSIVGTFSGNTIGTAGVAGSGSSQGNGVTFNATGDGTMTVLADGNSVRQWSNAFGFLVSAGDGSPAVDVTATNNLITEPDTAAFPINGLHLNAGTTAAGTAQVCLDVRNNDILDSAGTAFDDDFRLRQRNNSTVRLPGYAGAAGDTAAVVTFVQGNNTGTPSGSAAVNSSGFMGGAACATP